MKKDWKLLLVGSFCFAGALACDDVGGDEDAGASGDASADAGGDGGADAGPGADSGPVVKDTYNWIIINDTTDLGSLNASGTPGADICGVRFTCGAKTGFGVEAELERGQGVICQQGQTVGGSACSADRDQASAAVGDPSPCEAASSPSHYVALGGHGTLRVRVDTAAADILPGGLRGCSIEIVELTGRDTESYSVSVCADKQATDCHPTDPVGEAATGGNKTIVVPAN